MKQSYRIAAIGSALLSLTMTGCGLPLHPAYSAKVRYGLRTDPIVNDGASPKLGDERDEPDRPNTLPIMKLQDAFKPEHPYYAKRDELDEKLLRDPTKIAESDGQELEAALEAVFGTPAAPTVKVKEVDKATIDALQIDDATLAKGSTRYRVHCLHCHGVPGDGRGPTARWINPHPRDFRLGIFKFQSVDQASDGFQRQPSRADLMRTLRFGLEGTAMPSFNLLPDDELDAIVSYVIHLSIRGNVEVEQIKRAFDADKETGKLKLRKGTKIKASVEEYAALFVGRWAESQDPNLAIKVAPFPFDASDMDKLAASAQRGQQFFTAKPSDALKKHYTDMYFKTAFPKVKAARTEEKAREEASKKNPKLTKEEVEMIQFTEKDLADIKLSKDDLEQVAKDAAANAEKDAISKLSGAKCVTCHSDYGRQARYRFDDWGNLVRPNNLATGQLRGGRRPVDIYYRIHSGINGSGMNNFGGRTGLTGDEIWDIVNFVSNLPYPHMRERLGIRID